MSEPLTPKSERSRERIRDAAFALFAEKGFSATTMRDIAARADVSLGLAYRYYARKEDLALALYQSMSERLYATATGLYGGTLHERFETLMRATLAALEAHRGVFLAIASRAFDPADPIGVLGAGTHEVRAHAQAAWRVVVDGAEDAPNDAEQRRQLAAALYAWDLLVVLIWTQDRSEDRAATDEAVRGVVDGLRLMRPLLSTPFGADALARIGGIAGRLGMG